jgi:uncharacterized small protein (DUF1192 family)
MATKSKTIKIDNKDYSTDALSDAAKSQLVNLRVVDQEIARLKAQLAIHQTARAAYAAAVKRNLPKDA